MYMYVYVKKGKQYEYNQSNNMRIMQRSEL